MSFWSVNLIELPIILVITYFNLQKSKMIYSLLKNFVILNRSLISYFSLYIWNKSWSCFTTSFKYPVFKFGLKIPCSIKDRSMISSTKEVSKLAETYEILTNFHNSKQDFQKFYSVISFSFFNIISAELMIAFAGVQNSCETLASINH